MELQIITNRMSKLWEAAANEVRPQMEGKGKGKVHFSYMSQKPFTVTMEPNDVLFKLMRPFVYNTYANKGKLPRLLEEHGLIGKISPPTVYSVAEAQAMPDVPIWFSKYASGTGGKRMEVVGADDLATYELPKHHVLQAGVENLRLIDGRKAVTRIYVLVWDRQLHLYRDGFHVIHGQKYEEGSTSYDVQINHEGYRDPEKPVELRPLHDDPDYRDIVETMTRFAQTLAPAMRNLAAGSSFNDYVLLGIDTLIQNDGSMQLVEINAVPNFVHTREVNRTVNIPFLIFVLRKMLGLPQPN